jgi:hypothetical protein
MKTGLVRVFVLGLVVMGATSYSISAAVDDGVLAAWRNYLDVFPKCNEGVEPTSKCSAAADAVKTESDRLYADPAADADAKQLALNYVGYCYHLDSSMDLAINQPKLKAFETDCTKKFPGTPIAAYGESLVIASEVTTLTPTAFLTRLKKFVHDYPGYAGNSGLFAINGPDLVKIYAQKRRDKETDLVVKMLRASLTLFSQNNSVIAYKDSMDLEGKKAILLGTSLKGADVDLTKLAGKVVVLQFWAAGCPTALTKETANLASLYAKHKGPGFEMIGVSFQSPNEVRAGVTSQKIDWPQVNYSAPRGAKPIDFAIASSNMNFWAKQLLGVEQDNGMIGCREDHFRVVGKNGRYATHSLYTVAELQAVVEKELKK